MIKTSFLLYRGYTIKLAYLIKLALMLQLLMQNTTQA